MGERYTGWALSNQETESKGKPYLENKTRLEGNKEAEAKCKAGQEGIKIIRTKGGRPQEIASE